MWVPVEGKLAQACQPKLQTRIFLNDTRGSDVVKDYLSKMGREVGKKVKSCIYIYIFCYKFQILRTMFIFI